MPLGLIGAGISAAANLFGGSQAAKTQQRINEQNIALQKEFAQHGIRWKVEDAKAAGIHPVYALGAPTTSFSPIAVGGDPAAAGLAAAGQDIGRAVNAMRTPNERVTAYEEALRALQLQRGQLENTLLASRIRVLNQAGNPPGLPNDKLKPPERITHLRSPEGVIVTDPNLSDAQTFEDRYGELTGDMYGIRNWVREVGDQWLRRLWENERRNFHIGVGPYRWHPLRR